MIEVEIRGPLTLGQASDFKARLARDGRHLRHQDREMILLRDYPGYSKDPTERILDIRLRRTNGATEIMVKRQASKGNVARYELSLPIAGDHFGTAKRVLAELGFATGLWMHRVSDVYEYQGVEWTVAAAHDPQGTAVRYYFEAERESPTPDAIEQVRSELVDTAKRLGLSVLETDSSVRSFIYELDQIANREVQLNG